MHQSSGAGAAVLQIEHVRRYLGQVIHDATRSDLASRIAVHQAIPAFTRDLVELAEDRTVQVDRLDAAACALSRRARSCDATLAERCALRDAWASILGNAVDAGATQAQAARQVECWRLSDAFTLLTSVIPARYAFADGAVRASDMADYLDVLMRQRNQMRLRDVASDLRAAPRPVPEARRRALLDALAPVFRVDREHRPSYLALRARIATWSDNGSLAHLHEVLSAPFQSQEEVGLPGVSRLDEALGRRHAQYRRLDYAQVALHALTPLRTLSLQGRARHDELFRIVYALHDALRDAEALPSASVDTIWRQCETWRLASLLPLLPQSLPCCDVFLDGRLRLADIDAHLQREYRLLRALRPAVRVGHYPAAYRDCECDAAVADDLPWLRAFAPDSYASGLAAMSTHIDARAAERQFRLLEIVLLRETTTVIGRLHLHRGLRALRQSSLPARFNRILGLRWYETVLVDPVVAPFNTQVVSIVEDMIDAGVDLRLSPVDWVGLLCISPDTLGRFWRQRECFRLMSDRYRAGLIATGRRAEAGPLLSIDSLAMFSARLGDRRARALLRWAALACHRLLEEEPPERLPAWVDLLLDDTISDAAMDHWLAGLPEDAFQGGMPSVQSVRMSMRRFDQRV